MTDNDLADFEAEFPKDPGPSIAVPCRECHTDQARNGGCPSCNEVDGDCLYCQKCGGRRIYQMAAGAIEIRYQARNTPGWVEKLPTALSYCDLFQMVYLLTAIIADSAGEEIDRVVQAVRTMGEQAAQG